MSVEYSSPAASLTSFNSHFVFVLVRIPSLDSIQTEVLFRASHAERTCKGMFNTLYSMVSI